MTPSGVGPTVSGVPITSSIVESGPQQQEAADDAGNHQFHHVRQHQAEHAQTRGPAPCAAASSASRATRNRDADNAERCENQRKPAGKSPRPSTPQPNRLLLSTRSCPVTMPGNATRAALRRPIAEQRFEGRLELRFVAWRAAARSGAFRWSKWQGEAELRDARWSAVTWRSPRSRRQS